MKNWCQFIAASAVFITAGTASAFPAVWETIISQDGDAVQDGFGDSLSMDPWFDVVGTPQDGALFMTVDATDIYLRMRVDGDPSGMPILVDGAWSALLDVNADDLNYEIMMRINAAMNRVEIWVNTQGTNAGEMDDSPEFLLYTEPLVVDDNIRVVDAQSMINGTPDFFIDVRVPINAFRGSVARGTRVRVIAGTSPSDVFGLIFDATEGSELGTLPDHLSAPYVLAENNIFLCGNGIREPGEECDDGNLINGDNCTDLCRVEFSKLVIVEVMQDPASVPDGLGEWFEIKNVGNLPTDLSDHSVSDANGEQFVIEGPLPVGPMESVVLGRYADPAINGGVVVDYAYGGSMSLANGPDSIILRNANDSEVDRVEWDGGLLWPNPRSRGRSMQFGVENKGHLINNNDPEYWCRPEAEMPNGDLGTPGEENEACGPVADQVVLVITEVMQDPASVADGLGEWFELYNPGAIPVDLTGWTFTDGNTDSFVVESSFIIGPGDYAVLARHADPAINGGLIVDFAYGTGMLLANGADSIIVYDDEGTEITQVAWDTGATWPNPRGRGRSMQLDGNADLMIVDNNDPTLWCRPSTVMPNGDEGTPGVANDPCGVVAQAGTVVITEVMQDPASVRDGFGEWFEIYNPSATPLDLNGWTFEDGNNDSFVVGASVVIAPGGYAVLGRHADLAINGGIAVDYAYGAGMLLANSADGIIVRDGTGAEIDRVEWGAGWPNPKGRGRSMQLDGSVDIGMVDNNDPNQWCRPSTVMANGDEGTPGAANDPCGGGSVCGNGLVELGEACDDNNTTNGDGCNAQCQGESIIAIVEVMQDPMVVADGLGEWFEVHNPTPVDIDLNGWTFSDGNTDSFTVSGALVVPAGGYVVLGKFTDMAINGGVAVDYAFGPGMVLANQPDGIILTDATGAEIDRVEWGAGWPNPKGRGRSMQFGQQWDAIVDDNNDSSHWCRPTSTMGNGELGTPGLMNDLCP